MFVFKSYQAATTSSNARNQMAGPFARFARHTWPLWLALALFLLSPAAQGQLYTGSVTGVVTNPSGASVPGAKVTLVDQEKGYAFNAVTDSTGAYSVAPQKPLCHPRWRAPPTSFAPPIATKATSRTTNPTPNQTGIHRLEAPAS